MENLLPSLAQSVAVAGFIAAAFSGVVLRPIYNVITELKEAIKELRDGFTITTSIASGLTGYIGGRTQGK